MISSSGIMPAEYLKRRFGLPYIAGVPFESENDPVIRKIKAVMETNVKDREIRKSDRKLLIISEPVLGLSLAEYAKNSSEITVIDPTESDYYPAGRSIKLLKIRDEETLEGFISENRDFDVISDPEYFYLFSDKVKKISMPTLSVSGRIFKNGFIDYFKPGNVRKLLCQ